MINLLRSCLGWLCSVTKIRFSWKGVARPPFLRVVMWFVGTIVYVERVMEKTMNECNCILSWQPPISFDATIFSKSFLAHQNLLDQLDNGIRDSRACLVIRCTAKIPWIIWFLFEIVLNTFGQNFPQIFTKTLKFF